MATYEQTNFEQISAAIGVQIEQVAKHETLFKAAARWYGLDSRRPTRTAPFEVRKRLDRVDKNASRLLKSLGVNDPDEAPTLHLPGIATNDYPPCHYMNRGIHSRVLLRARW